MPDWKEHGIHVVRAVELDPNTPQTPGRVAQTLALECLIPRSEMVLTIFHGHLFIKIIEASCMG